ncbi:MAG TPA: AMP-binding protein [Desulfomonilaceae bacterium]|nr:AMP-binding protein [Desulfomonilaceae bacterium]
MHHVDRNSGILNAEERFSPDERRGYQERFLQEIVSHAYGSGTPLKAAMDAQGIKSHEIRTLEDLSQIPITKKKDLSDAQKMNPPFGGYVTVPISDLVRIHQSPGPIYDPVGKVHDYWRWKTALHSAGFRPGDIVVNTFAYHLTPAGHMFEEGVSELGGTIIPTGVGNTETQADIMKNLGVTGYIGTPSFLMAIFKKAEDLGMNPAENFKLEVAFLLAEMLPESMRKRFMDEYRVIGRQAYGTADVGCVAYECPHVSGMHVHYDVIVEIVDPETGQVLPIGEPGEVVVTTKNKIYPLIRFGTGDLSSLTEEPCACGRTMPRLTRIMGRADQLTKVKGMFVHPSQVQKVIDAYPEIVRARLLVERPKDQDVMTLELELKEPVAEGFIVAVEETLREAVKIKGSVRIIESGSLKPDQKLIEDVRKWD